MRNKIKTMHNGGNERNKRSYQRIQRIESMEGGRMTGRKGTVINKVTHGPTDLSKFRERGETCG